MLAGLYLTLQLTIPLAGFLTGTPYFGWRMFSEVRLPPRAVITRPGSLDTVSVNKYVGFPRGDLTYGPDLASQLCRLIEDAISIRVLASRTLAVQEAKCH